MFRIAATPPEFPDVMSDATAICEYSQLAGPSYASSLLYSLSCGELSETLFYISPTRKGDADEGIAEVRPNNIIISICAPSKKGL